MAKTDPVLELTTLTDRASIRIDGKPYELRHRDEFAYMAFRRHAHRFQRLGQLLRAKTISEKAEKEQSRLLDQFTQAILIAPPAVHAKLRDTHRLEIVKAFSSLLPTRTTPAGAAPRTARSRSRSAASSRG